MADKKPIYAGLKADGTFVYAKELDDSVDGVDANKVSYDQTGNTHLTSNNISDNIDVIETIVDGWNSTKILPSFEAQQTNAFDLYPRSTDLDVPFNIVISDSESGWSVANNEYTIPESGIYEIECTLTLNTNNPNHLNFWFNGTHRLFSYIISILIDNVVVKSGERTVTINRTTATDDTITSGMNVYTLENLTAGQKVSISVYRYYVNGTITTYADTAHILNSNGNLNVLTINKV